ncbi:MAG: MFS transporter [Candidatus Micrarchaeota archaeon]
MDLFSTDLRRFYVSVALRHFGLALITLFVPAYLYKELGFSVQQVLVYYLIQEISSTLIIPFAGKFIAKFGTRNAMLLSVPFSFLTYLFMPLSQNLLFLLGATISRALFASIYFLSFHVYLARNSKEGRIGEATGKAWSVLRLAVLAGPLTGGVILQFVGYSYAFGMLVVLQLLSVIALPKNAIIEKAPSFFGMVGKVNWRESFSWFAQGVAIEAGDFLWGLYAFTIVLGYAYLGALSFVAGLAIAIFSLWLGKKTDHISRDVLLSISWLLGGISWFGRAIFGGIAGILFGNISGEAAFMTMETPIMYKIYDEGRKKNDLLSRLVVREVFLRLGIIPVFILAWFLPFEYVFAGIGIFFLILFPIYFSKK